MIEHYINHIVFVLDESGSMGHLTDDVVKVFDGQISNLAQRSKEVKQETRVSVYTFSSSQTTCLIYDMDVLRLPSLKGYYRPGGGTPLIDGTLKAIEDLKLTPELYCDHAFLIFVLTDGQENTSKKTPATLISTIKGLKDNWTVATLVPDAYGVSQAKQFGFPADNVKVWSAANAAGVVEVGETIRKATDGFMRARATGVRSTKNLFSLDTTNLNKTVVKSLLDPLKPSEYDVLLVRKDGEAIKKFVESWLTDYTIGSAYYQITKPEVVQASKQILVQEKATGKVFGGDNARNLVNLPSYDVKVGPTKDGKFVIFCQSTSVNRKLVSGTQVIVLK